MTTDSLRSYCLSFPHSTEKIQWGSDLLFCVGGKMFAVMDLDASRGVRLSFKCTPEQYGELVERDGVVPAPYLARYHWVGLTRLSALSDAELGRLLRESYEMVSKKLAKRVRTQLKNMRTAS